jgi:putative spermidine/putrescine transport system substrate-binding protein
MRRIGMAVTVVALGLVLAAHAGAQTSLGFASYGGAYQDAQRKVLLDPAGKALNATFTEGQLFGVGPVRDQVKAGQVKWDIAVLSLPDAAIASKEGLVEPLDYGVIDARGLTKEMAHKDFLCLNYTSNIIAWNAAKFAGGAPQTWADFFDTARFPGARALRNRAITSLEIALLADGVAPDTLYPLDVDRGFRFLEKHRGSIGTFWTAGAQPADLVKTGKVELTHIWSGRAVAAQREGVPIQFHYNQGILGADCVVVPKGAPQKALAMKVIATFVDPARQAELAKLLDYGPTNARALEVGMTKDEAARMNSSPQNIRTQVLIDPWWWAENGARVEARWAEFVKK